MGDIIFTSDKYNYSIYQNGGYYICISDKEINDYQMFIGFSDKDLGLSSNHVIVDEIRKVSDLLFSHSKDGIYVVPVVNPSELERVASVNENKVYDEFLNRYILPVTSDINKNFNTNNKHLNDVIGFIKQRDIDKKIIDGIDMSVARDIVVKTGTTGKDYIKAVDIEVLKKSNGILDVDFLQTDDNIFVQNTSSSIAPVNHQYDQVAQSKENVHVRKLVKPTNGLPGFSSMGFIIMVIGVSTLLVVGIITLILK